MQLISVIIDAAELEPESEFWHRLLGGSRMQTPTHHFIQADGLPMFVVQLDASPAGHPFCLRTS
ncbi:hypothetical protein GCM10009609_43120 [Pseudonocardia aurantiaca]|uniref:Glyoxalase-like domain-containing protein n=1 Tax=Pseudonocardia aurantiaca TaxID=75290 RepID=A0ABW4FWT4_9PSEU